MVLSFYTLLREGPVYALLLAAALLGGAGALALWLGIDEGLRVLVSIGAVLTGMGVAALVMVALRGLGVVGRRVRAIAHRQRARSKVWRPVLFIAAVVLALASALAVHNYVTWRGIERDCEQALRSPDRVSGERAFRRGRRAMEQRLLLLPSSLFDLWGPNRCRSASRRYSQLPGGLAEPGRPPDPGSTPATTAPISTNTGKAEAPIAITTTTEHRTAASSGAAPRPYGSRYRLRRQKLTDKAFSSWLAGRTPSKGLYSLDLRDNKLSGAAVTAIAKSSLGYPTSLLLSNNPLGDRGARALARGKGRFHMVSVLYLAGTRISAAGVAAMLAEDSALSHLVQLDLSYNPIGDDGVVALAGSKHAKSLTTLSLTRIGMTDLGARALARSPNLVKLASLFVDENQLSAAGIKALRDSPRLKKCTVFFGDKDD